MKEFDVKYLIDWEERIVFKANYIDIREDDGLLCSLEGEFLKDNRPFEPRLKYSMSNVGVTSRDPAYILGPIYHTLRLQRELSEKLKTEKT